MSPMSGGKAAEQVKGDRVAGDAQADRVLAAGDRIGYPRLLFENQGQRASYNFV